MRHFECLQSLFVAGDDLADTGQVLESHKHVVNGLVQMRFEQGPGVGQDLSGFVIDAMHRQTGIE